MQSRIERRFKASLTSGFSPKFSLKCVKLVQKCVNELRRILSGIENMQRSSGLSRHQMCLIQQCGKNLMTALMSCNLFRIPFAEEVYYLTQLTKIERSITQMFDVVASLDCRKFPLNLGNNKNCDDLFATLENTFDSFVGPLLHIFNSFNVRCLLFQCDKVNLDILDSFDANSIRKKLCLFTLEPTPIKTVLSQQVDELDEESEVEDLQSTNESTSQAIAVENNSSSSESKSVGKKPLSIEELFEYYRNREGLAKNDGEERNSQVKQEESIILAELAILIDFISNEDPSRYEITFLQFYNTLFDEQMNEKIAAILRNSESFRALNYFVNAVFYDPEISNLSLEEILKLIRESSEFQFRDLRLKLVRSSYEAPQAVLDQFPFNTSQMFPAASSETEQSYTAARVAIPFVSVTSQNIPATLANASNSMRQGDVLCFCPHAHSLIDGMFENDERLNSCECSYLTKKFGKQQQQEQEANEEESDEDDKDFYPRGGAAAAAAAFEQYTDPVSEEKRIIMKKAMVFGRRAQNSIQKVDFTFGEHENLISRQQFSVTYESFSNEYNVQCLSQSSLTQLVIDEVGFELTEGCIFVIQDMIAFQVVSATSVTKPPRFGFKPNMIDESVITGCAATVNGIGSSISELAHRLSRQFSIKSLSGRNRHSQEFSEGAFESFDLSDPKKYQKLYRKQSSSNRISYRGSMMLGGDSNSKQKKGFEDESSSENSDEGSNDDSSDSDDEENNSISKASNSNKKSSSSLASISLSHLTNIADQPGALLKTNRKSFQSQKFLVPLRSRSSVTEVILPVNEQVNEIVLDANDQNSATIAPTDEEGIGGESTMDYKKSQLNVDENDAEPVSDVVGVSSGLDQDSRATQTSNGAIGAAAPTNSNVAAAAPVGQMGSSLHLLNSMSMSVSHMNSSKTFQTQSRSGTQSMFDFDDDKPAEEAVLQLKVLWSNVDTEKEDYRFVFDPNGGGGANTTAGAVNSKLNIKRVQSSESGSNSEVEEENEKKVEADMVIHFGSSSIGNHIQIQDSTNKIRKNAHCSISYSDDGWTIFAQHDSMQYYSGLALKKSDEVENGLISKKILIEKGYQILVNGYIFECDI